MSVQRELRHRRDTVELLPGVGWRAVQLERRVSDAGLGQPGGGEELAVSGREQGWVPTAMRHIRSVGPLLGMDVEDCRIGPAEEAVTQSWVAGRTPSG